MDAIPSGFQRWWATWPRSPRKGGRKQCLAVWVRKHLEAQADDIVRHTAWLCVSGDWQKDGGSFIPMPITYLNQERWDGAEIPANAVPETAEEYTARMQREREAAKGSAPTAEQRARLEAARGAIRRIA